MSPVPPSPTLFVANVTPFSQGTVDLGQLRAHTRWMADQGVQGFAPTGTTGEFLYLTLAEKRDILRTVLVAAEGRVPVIPCVWHPSAVGMQQLAQEAQDHGAWGIFAPPPLYHAVPEETIVRWYAALRQATPMLPVLAYHHPNTHNPLSLALIARLTTEVGVWGLKDSSRDRARICALTAQLPGRVYVGGDELLGQAASCGPLAGHISGYANAYPAHARALISGASAEEQALLLPRLAAIRAGGGTAAALKARLGMGHRLPLDAVNAEAVACLPAPAGWPPPPER